MKLIVALALLLAACSGASPPKTTAAPTTTTPATTVAPTTRPPATTAAANGLGTTQIHNFQDETGKSRAKITLLAYTPNALIPAYRNDPSEAPRAGFRYVAIQVRVCLVSKSFPEDITVSWEPWSLATPDGDTYEPAGSYSPDTLVSPLYPETALAVGQCRKGWIPFAVPNNWKPASVEYSPALGGTLTWRL